MVQSASPSQNQLELHVLRCLVERSPRSLSDVRDWIGQNVELDPEARRMIKMPSGKEPRLHERSVGNLLTPQRSGNLTDRKFVDRPGRDCYVVTEFGRSYLAEQEQLLAELEDYLKDLKFDG
jgi:restriction endonuclease Mrr